MSTHKRGRVRHRGSILLLSIFFLIVLFSLSVAFFRIIPAEFHSASASRARIQANYAADSGGHHAVNWIKFRMEANGSSIIPEAQVDNYNATNFGSTSTNFASNDWPAMSPSDPILQAHKLDDQWSFLSRIRMDDSDFFRRIYTIESCAYLRGKPQRVVKMTVQNESFAKFALYISDWDENHIFTMGPNGIQGPVHTNDYLRVAAPGGLAYWNATKGDGSPEDPWVNGPQARITQSGAFRADSTSPDNTLDLPGDGIQYANGNSFQADPNYVPFDSGSSPIPERYEKIVTNGRDNIKQINDIPMPEQNSDLGESAWGGPLPTNSSGWNAAKNGDDGYMMVMTDTGHVNDPTGTVSGGIFIDRNNVDDFLLDITPEGHQKTRIRQGWTSVDTPGSTSYWANVPVYHRQVTIPAYTTEENRCTAWETVQVPNYVNETRTRTVTQQNGSECGYDTIFIEGENGVSTPVQVARTCTYEETYTVRVQDGTRDQTNCTNRELVTVNHPEQTYWEDCDENDSGALQYRTNWEEVDPNYPGATEQQDRHSVQRWNSVVEVNDTAYQIPFYNGVKVNGETITDPNDPRLTVSDGHTVQIKNDYTDNKGSYGEYTVMNGRINGVIFSDENIWNARGTVKGSKYEDADGNLKYQGKIIATNIAKGKDLEIQDSILQYYDGNGVDQNGDPLNDGNNRLVVGNTSPDGKHILGLVAEDIWIDVTQKSKNYENTDNATRETGFNGGNFKGGVNVYAILMAGRMYNGNERGAFQTRSNDMEWSDGLGDFNLYGGLISAKSGQTQRTDGNNPRGFRLNLNYDAVAAEFLQYFETTNVFTPLRYVTYHPLQATE